MVLRFATGAIIRITHTHARLTDTTDPHGSRVASSSALVHGTAGAGAIPGMGTGPAGMGTDGAIAADGVTTAAFLIVADSHRAIEAGSLRVHSPVADSMVALQVADSVAAWAAVDSTAAWAVADSTAAEAADFTAEAAVTAKTGTKLTGKD